MRTSTTLKIVALSVPGTLLILAAALIHDARVQGLMLCVGVLVSIILFSAIIMRQHQRNANYVNRVYDKIEDTRRRQSQKEYEILSQLSAHQNRSSRSFEEMLSRLLTMEQALEVLSQTIDSSNVDEAEKVASLLSDSPQQLHPDDQRNRVALQHLLGTLLRTQEEILQRLGDRSPRPRPASNRPFGDVDE